MEAVARKNKTNDLRVSGAPDKGTAGDTKRLKVRFAFKAAAFIASVITLSWFFEGWRKVNEALTIAHVGILVGGTLLTLALIGLQAYWIYIEEKSKGTLKKKIGLFDKIESYLESLGSKKGEQ